MALSLILIYVNQILTLLVWCETLIQPLTPPPPTPLSWKKAKKCSCTGINFKLYILNEKVGYYLLLFDFCVFCFALNHVRFTRIFCVWNNTIFIIFLMGTAYHYEYMFDINYGKLNLPLNVSTNKNKPILKLYHNKSITNLLPLCKYSKSSGC